MNRFFLKSVSIEGFRGINNDGDPLVLRFRPDSVNSLHAPNGVGKSSIFEALQFAIHGTVQRLEHLQDAELGHSYIVNKFHPAQEATIDLVFSHEDGSEDVAITVARGSAGERTVTSPSGQPDPEEFLASLREDYVLVDYSRFSSLIDSSSLDRGRSLASLVGLSRYSRLRQALEGAKDTRNINSDLGLSELEREIAGQTRTVTTLEERIVTLYNEITGEALEHISDLARHKAHVTTKLSVIPILAPLLSGITFIELDFAAAEQAIDQEDGGSARKALEALGDTVTSLSGLQVVEDDIDQLDALLTLARARDAALQAVGAGEMHSILTGALAVVTGEQWPDPYQCPVCDNIGDVAVADQLRSKIALFEEVDGLETDLKTRAVASTGLAKLQSLEEFAGFGIAATDRVSLAISLALRQGRLETVVLARARTQLEALEADRMLEVISAQSEMKALQDSLPPSLVQVARTLGHARQLRDSVAEYESELLALTTNQAKLSKLKRWRDFMTSVSQAFSSAETALANARIAEVQASCQEIFVQLVRGGPNVKPTLSRARNSEHVDLKLADFFGLCDQSARALLSESYRNAVAASIFLASAIRYGGVPRFMILDDVTSSFDAGHQFSLMDAIRSRLQYRDSGGVSDGLQFIILSHDSSLEKYFDRLNGTKEWHHQKLQGMPPQGRLMVSTQEADRLKAQAQHYLNLGQIDLGEPFVRQYLEYKLSQVINRLGVLVPPDYATHGDRRTLSTFMNAILTAVTLYQQAQRLVMNPQQVADLQGHHAPAIMSNYITHYETGTGSPFNAYALLGVLQSIDDLAACFMWTDESGSPRYYKALDRR